MFEGFRSRWSRPREWACSSPSASRAAIQAEALDRSPTRGGTAGRAGRARRPGEPSSRLRGRRPTPRPGAEERAAERGEQRAARPIGGPGTARSRGDTAMPRDRLEAGRAAAGRATRSSASIRLRPRSSAAGRDAGGVEHLGEVRAAEIRHADQPEPGSGRSSQTEWIGTMWVCWSLARTRGSSPSALETFRATGRLPRRRLVGEVDPGERAPAQLGDEPEAADRLAELGEDGRLFGARHGPGRVAARRRGPWRVVRA